MIELVLLKSDKTRVLVKALDPTPKNLLAALRKMSEIDVESDDGDYVSVDVFGTSVAIVESRAARFTRNPMTLKQAKATLAMWPEVAEWERMKAAQDEAIEIGKDAKASSTVTDPRRGSL